MKIVQKFAIFLAAVAVSATATALLSHTDRKAEAQVLRCSGTTVTTPTASFSVTPANPPQSTQTYPTTLAAIQSAFPGTTATKTYTFQETSGNVIEQTGSGQDLVAHGTPHYGLWTPFTTATTHISTEDQASYFEPAAGTTLDPAGATFSVLAWVRWDYDAYSVASYLLAKYNGTGFMAWEQSGQVHFYVRDGVTGVQLDSVKNDYTTGAWHPVAFVFDAASSQLRVYTDEETASVSSGAIVPANVTVPAQVATVMGANAHNSAFLGGLRYLAFLNGHAITQSEFNAWVVYGTDPTLGLAYTSTPTRGRTSFDNRNVDGLGPRVQKWSYAQVATDYRYNIPMLPVEDSLTNYLYPSERLWDNAYWTQANTPTVTAYAYQAPDGSFTATKLSKTSVTASGVGISRSTGSISVSQINGSVWMRADTATNGYIRLSLTGDTTQTLNQTCALTTTWSRCFVGFGPITYVAGTTGVLNIYPADPNSTTATGTIYVWGAQVASNSSTLTPDYYPTYTISADNGSQGNFQGNAAFPSSGSFWAEIVYTHNDIPTNNYPWLKSKSVAGTAGGITWGIGSPSQVQAALYNSDGTSAYSASNNWNTNKFMVIGNTVDAIISVNPATGKMLLCIQGACEGEISTGAIPANYNSTFVTGFDVDNPYSHLNASIYRLRTGSGYLTPAQALAMAKTAPISVTRRFAAVGDSITGFPYSWHDKLNLDFGTRAVTANLGVSGNTTTQMVARFANQVTFTGHGFTDVGILGGINDICVYGTGSQSDINTVESNLQSMYSAAAAAGISRIIALTITPFKGNTVCTWTAQKQTAVDTVNAWIKSLAGGQTCVVDTYAAMGSTGDAQTLNAAYTSDGLHPNNAGQNVMGDLVYSTCYGNTGN